MSFFYSLICRDILMDTFLNLGILSSDNKDNESESKLKD
jgi:hypothetical protein